MIFWVAGSSNRAVSIGEEVAQEWGSELLSSPEVESVRAAYQEDEGIYLYTDLSFENRREALSWIFQQIQLKAEMFERLNKRDEITWIYAYDGSGSKMEGINVPAAEIGALNRYQMLTMSVLPPILLNSGEGDPFSDMSADRPSRFSIDDLDRTLDEETRRSNLASSPNILPWFERYEQTFEERSMSEWVVVSGKWEIEEERLAQTEQNRSRTAVQLASQPLAKYRIEGSFERLGGGYEMGFLLNAPQLGTEADADYVLLTDNGETLEVGYIDAEGINQFQNNFKIDPPLETEGTNLLSIDANAGSNMIYINGRELGRYQSRRASGYVGLIADQSTIALDNFSIENFEGRAFGSDRPTQTEVVDPPAANPVEIVPPDVDRPVVETVVVPPSDVAEPIQAVALPVEEVESGPPIISTDPAGGAEAGRSNLATYTVDFETGADDWTPVSGAWETNDGLYEQVDATGFDLITMLDTQPLTDFVMEGDLRMAEGNHGGGFIYNAPDPESSIGAHVVDFYEGGAFLRWGYYNEDRTYVFSGGTELDPGLSDNEFHTLRLETRKGETVVFVDGEEITVIENQNEGGYVGLVSSEAKLQFDNLFINRLAPEEDEVTAGQVERFDQALDDNWKILSGDWQVIDQELRQRDVNGFDLTTISPFRGTNYQVKADVRLIGGVMGAGIIYNMQSQDSLAGSQMFNFTQFGEAIQWGRFDDAGQFIFQGLREVDQASNGAWHTLTLDVLNGQATIRYDDILVAENIPLNYTEGNLGFMSSTSHIAFDNITITDFDLETTEANETAPNPTEISALFTFESAEELLAFNRINGEWIVEDGVLIQTEETLFDRSSSLNYEMVSPYSFQADLRLIAGSMGGGLLFNMRSRTSKNRSHMASFTADGRFLQWGDFDDNGVFNIKGSLNIEEIAEIQIGEWNTLLVEVLEDRFALYLNDTLIVDEVPLVYQTGHQGLFSNLSRVEFDNVTLSGQGIDISTISDTGNP